MLMKVQRDADGRTALDIMRTLLLSLLLSAVLSGSFSQKFDFVRNRMNWTDAQIYCRDKYTDLATITDMSDQNEVINYVTGPGKIWIGLYRKNAVSPWIWSDQSQFLFESWASRQPNSHDSFQTCVVTDRDGWFDRLCTEENYFVCYNATALPTGALPTGAPPTGAPPTGALPTGALPTGVPPTGAPPTGALPTGVPPTGAPPTGSLPTGAPPTGALPTGALPTGALPTGVSPTSAPPTGAPSTGMKRQMLRVEVKSDENVNDPEVKKKVLEKIQHILNMKGLGGNVTLSWRNQSDGNVFQKNQQNRDTEYTCH